jgi:hypothetical protein
MEQINKLTQREELKTYFVNIRQKVNLGDSSIIMSI